MNIHEYQAKAVLREFGVPVPRGYPALTVDEALKAAADLATPVVVVKAQIHAGGRGKAGGVKVVKSHDDVRKEAQRLLGSVLVTHQTGPLGKQVNRLYIEEGSAIAREFYLSALVDRETSRVSFVVSTAGGMNIEEVAHDLRHIADVEDKPVGTPNEYDEFHFLHQCPGGMVSNLAYQLETMGLKGRLEEILEEAWHVREDLGYPIVVSPFAQYIVTQAVLNVMGRDQGKPRYETVPDEVRLYVRGGYGEIAGPIDQTLYDKITRGAQPITERPGALVPPALERIRKDRGPFASNDDLLLAAFYDDANYSALKSAGPIRTDYSAQRSPLIELVKGLADRKSVSRFALRTD